MRFYQSFLLPFIPNLISYVEVSSGVISYRAWGIRQFSFKLKDVFIEIETSGFFGVLVGFGEVTLNKGGTSRKIKNVMGATELLAHVEKLQNPEDNSHNSYGPKRVKVPKS